MTHTIRLTSLALILIAALGAVGCNTTRGLGEDVEATGEAVQGAAQRTEDKLEDQ